MSDLATLLYIAGYVLLLCTALYLMGKLVTLRGDLKEAYASLVEQDEELTTLREENFALHRYVKDQAERLRLIAERDENLRQAAMFSAAGIQTPGMNVSEVDQLRINVAELTAELELERERHAATRQSWEHAIYEHQGRPGNTPDQD